MSRQKFHRGDIVHIAKKLGRSMSHFEADQDVVVIGSYCDQFHGHGRPMLNLPHKSIAPVADRTVEFEQPDDCCGPNGHSYTVLFMDGAEVSWYDERQLKMVRHGGEPEIERIIADRAKREDIETRLESIVANWAALREGPPSHVANFLMGLVGISEPWGSQGEGMAYAMNWMQTLKLIDPVMSEGSVDRAYEFFKQGHQLKAIDVRIGG